MFRLSVVTDEISQDLERAVSAAREYGLEGVEIRSAWDSPPQRLDKEAIARVKRVVSSAGIRVCCVASPFFKCDFGDPDQYAEHLDILRRCCALAHELEAPLVRGFTFWRKGDPKAIWDRLLDAFAEPVRIMESEGLVLGLENEYSVMTSTAALTAQFIADLDTPYVRGIWDTSNEVFAEGGERPYPEAYERMRPYMVHCHVKDSKWNEDHTQCRCVAVGEGVVDFPGQLQALVDDGYEGYVSLETHWRPDQLPEELLRTPGGTQYSSAGEYASRVCLAALRRMMEGLSLPG